MHKLSDEQDQLRSEYIQRIKNVAESGTDSPLRLAYNVALDIRKFEIELYWKRATFFWTVVAATLVAYGAVATTSFKSFSEAVSTSGAIFFLYQVALLVLAGMGIILSCGWRAANKGSKFWQSNWESQVDLLEDYVVGPLYKTVVAAHTIEKESVIKNLWRRTLLTEDESKVLLEKIVSPTKVNELFSSLFIYIFSILFVVTALAILLPPICEFFGYDDWWILISKAKNVVKVSAVIAISIFFYKFYRRVAEGCFSTTPVDAMFNISTRSPKVEADLTDILRNNKGK